MIVHLAVMAEPYLRKGEFLADAEFDADSVKL
jgi:hypothetical protein